MSSIRPITPPRSADIATRARALPFSARAVSYLLFTILFTGCGPTSFLITPVPAARALHEQVIRRESMWATKKLVIIDVDGVLRNSRDRSLTGLVGDNPVALFKEKLDRAARDKNVRAVVLRINSPGGTVTASDLMYTELRDFRQRTGKPVVASMLDVAASGGYYLACAADQIYAHPTTVTGSIGVVMVVPEFSTAMAKLGIRTNVFKSGRLKDAGSPFRQMNQHDREIFEGLIARMYDRFFEVVRQSRSQTPEERLRELADGRVLLGPQAREQGLVDEIGTLEDALEAAREAAGLADQAVLVVRYVQPLTYRPNVYARANQLPAQINLFNVELPEWLRGPAPQFLYLWAPGW